VIQVRIAGLSLDPRNNQPVLVLRALEPPYDDRLLPIWIGHAEATAIVMALEGHETPRPMTHDLFKDALDTVGILLERVEITRVDEGTFYAALVLRGEDHTWAIDSRPSDSIALAVRTGSPLFVAEQVLAEASVPISVLEDEELAEEEEIEEFREFLERVDPADFQE
jgi:bifunctional DNase/RNase